MVVPPRNAGFRLVLEGDQKLLEDGRVLKSFFPPRNGGLRMAEHPEQAVFELVLQQQLLPPQQPAPQRVEVEGLEVDVVARYL